MTYEEYLQYLEEQKEKNLDAQEDIIPGDITDDVKTTEIEKETLDEAVPSKWDIDHLDESVWNNLIDPVLDQIPGVDDFKDWLYKHPPPEYGDIDISAPLEEGEIRATDVEDAPVGSKKWEDTARFAIQTAGKWGDLWKDLGMLPINLAVGADNPFSRILDDPKWTEDIGYGSEWADLYGGEGMQQAQEFARWAGPGLVGKMGFSGIMSQLPRIKKLLSHFYPITGKGFKKGLFSLKPGRIPFNIGAMGLVGEFMKYRRGEPNLFTSQEGRLGEIRTGGADLIKRGGDWLSNAMAGRGQAGAAELPSVDRGYAAGQMPTPVSREVRAPSNRAMMEMANTRGPGPRDDYRGL